MKLFSSLKKQATVFLEQYKSDNPATYAAAEQAVGGLLILDGFVGIENPFGGRKRPGIFGAVVGIVLGIIFMFIPTIVGNVFNTNKMTSATSATVVSVSSNSNTSTDSSSCSLSVRYLVDNTEYIKQSGISSSSYCKLTTGEKVTINYNPANPSDWIYDIKSLQLTMQIFFWVGLLAIISSIITFIIRLFSIVFGWKLLRDGRKNASTLPQGTNLSTVIEEIKKNFAATVFNFGNTTQVQAQSAPPQENQKPTDQNNE